MTKNLIDLLYREWQIWSKCFGKVILLNGVSSVGKTTVANYLGRFGFNKISIDDIFDEIIFGEIYNVISPQNKLMRDDIKRLYFGYSLNKSKYSKNPQKNDMELLENSITLIRDKCNSYFKDPKAEVKFYDRIYNKAKKFIFAGEDVVIDIVMFYNSIGCLSYCFGNYPIQMILLYSSLAKNLQNCFFRNTSSIKENLVNFRYSTDIIKQYLIFYKFTNNSTTELVIEKVDKSKTKDILGQVIENVLTLLDYIGCTKEEKDTQVKESKLIIKEIVNLITLNSNDVYVSLREKHNFLNIEKIEVTEDSSLINLIGADIEV